MTLKGSLKLVVPKSVRILQPTAVAQYNSYIGLAVRELQPIAKKIAQDETPVGATANLRTKLGLGSSNTGFSIEWLATHAVPVFYGSKRHWAPIAPIRAWVIAKLGSSDPRLPYKIQASIAKKGTRVNKYRDRARSKIYQTIVPIFKQRMALLAKILSGDFNP